LEPIRPVVDHEHDLPAIQGSRIGHDREEATVPVEVRARGEHGGGAGVDERHAGAGRLVEEIGHGGRLDVDGDAPRGWSVGHGRRVAHRRSGGR
jgi:hypothetical protein